ncbi:HAMP domain-containing sensor histidine kinase [Aquicoccus sp. G2-2]|uniref:sensor histidine kinase n=1 Tax=Aquicoccus sp. G2-2 TaxID=3092120 RepID=UPI002AE05AB1|nr:HAMP domain-containing sensor histidine kinase [Aquicoccus sp. G2-2]MEA1113941.1 HAMP domain-containing sensor histidine kinase [Aquicoccus sp. G2-2]
MRDYARVGVELFSQRLVIYAAAFLMEACYYSWILAVLSLSVLIISEAYDYFAFRKILKLDGRDATRTRVCLRMLQFGTVLSAVNIAGFAISIALLQGHTTHFMPLFFLFAAALFAAMNNHQITSILHLRLAIYFAAFLFIPLYDIVSTGAPFSSELWAQFFTSLFVLFFIADSSRVSSELYKKTLEQMDDVKRQHEKTKAALAAKSEFLATVSHELRTPLTSIKGSLDLVGHGAMGEMPERMEKVLSIAQRNATRLNALINDLLDLQKMEAGRMSFQFDIVNLGSLLAQAVASNQPFAQNLNTEIILEDVAKDLYVSADAARLEQVLSNILSNAAKFSEAGSEITLRAKPQDGKVRIEVVDCGIGLAEEHRETVFEEFSQVDSSDRRKVGGTGLGLNISRRIVNAHGGVLDYIRNEGAGTTFYVDLALVDVAVGAVKTAQHFKGPTSDEPAKAVNA